MFAIQSGSKFVKVEYYIDPDNVWNVVISSTPKTYKTQAAAQADLDRMIEWLNYQATRAQEIINSAEVFVVNSKKKVTQLEAKLEELMNMPFRQVEKQVNTIRKSIEQAARQAEVRSPTARSYKQDLIRYNKIRSAPARVVKVKQTVESV